MLYYIELISFMYENAITISFVICICNLPVALHHVELCPELSNRTAAIIESVWMLRQQFGR